MTDVAITAGEVRTIFVAPTEGHAPYTYSLPDDAPDWMVLGNGFVQMSPPPAKHPGGSGETTVTIMDAEGQTVIAVIRWAVTPTTPAQ